MSDEKPAARIFQGLPGRNSWMEFGVIPRGLEAMKHRDEANVKVAESTHAIPAQEQTKCAKEETKREGIKVVGSLVSVGMVLAFLCFIVREAIAKLINTDLAWVLVACAGVAVGGGSYTIYRLTGKAKTPQTKELQGPVQ